MFEILDWLDGGGWNCVDVDVAGRYRSNISDVGCLSTSAGVSCKKRVKSYDAPCDAIINYRVSNFGSNFIASLLGRRCKVDAAAVKTFEIIYWFIWNLLLFVGLWWCRWYQISSAEFPAKMTPKWHQNDTKMIPKWHEYDTKMTLNWCGRRQRMDWWQNVWNDLLINLKFVVVCWVMMMMMQVASESNDSNRRPSHWLLA